ncbi:MAG: hypothetical protein Q9168_002639, partial [Polycauliona sp. 1 TL-2023]
MNEGDVADRVLFWSAKAAKIAVDVLELATYITDANRKSITQDADSDHASILNQTALEALSSSAGLCGGILRDINMAVESALDNHAALVLELKMGGEARSADELKLDALEKPGEVLLRDDNTQLQRENAFILMITKIKKLASSPETAAKDETATVGSKLQREIYQIATTLDQRPHDCANYGLSDLIAGISSDEDENDDEEEEKEGILTPLAGSYAMLSLDEPAGPAQDANSGLKKTQDEINEDIP